MVRTRDSFGHVTLQEPPRSKFILTRELSQLCDLSNVRGMLFIKTPRRPSCQSGGSACVLFFERSEGRSRGISRTSEYYRGSSERGLWMGGATFSGRAQALQRRDSAARKGSFRDDCRSGLRQDWNRGDIIQTWREYYVGGVGNRYPLPSIKNKTILP